MKKRKKILLVAGAALALTIVYLRIPGGKLWKEFQSAAARSLSETQVADIGVITEEQISLLPQPLQRYFTACGYVGKPMIQNACITFRDVPFVLSQGKDSMPISYQQYNTLGRPDRMAFVNGYMAGIPFQGLDYYLNGDGYFTGTLAKQIPVVHSADSGEAVNRAFLLTFLGDGVLMPSVFLAEYVTCTEVDAHTVKVGISYYGTEAEGLFFFNDAGEITGFTCEDRLYDEGKGVAYPARWTIETADYKVDEKTGVRRPHSAKVYWNLPEGDYVYFSSDNFTVEYNLAAPTGKMVQP